jgi:exopolysaccharide biosynthesis polyprenyl glycosylphosphotransferase
LVPPPRSVGWDAAGRTGLSQEGIAHHGGVTGTATHARPVPAPPDSDLHPDGFVPASSTPDPAPAPAPASRHRHVLLVLGAIALDLVALAAGVILPALLRFTPEALLASAATPAMTAMIVLAPLIWITALSAREGYTPRVMASAADQAMRVFGAVLPAWVFTQLLAFLVKATVPFESRLVVGLSLPATLLAIGALRLGVLRPVTRRTYPRLARGPVLVLGDTDRAHRIAMGIGEMEAPGREVSLRPLSAVTPEIAARLVSEREYGEVVIEPNGRGLDEVLDVAFACLDARADVRVVSSRFQIVIGRSAIGDVDGIPVLRFRRHDLLGPEAVVKRMVDVIGAAAGLVVLSPVLVAIAVAVRMSSPGPVLFRQERVGHRGRRFTMLKFRTMEHGNDPRIHQQYLRELIRKGAAADTSEDGAKIYKLTRDPRVTRIGAWLRALSLDELPQLWNVLRGEMSLVGPRPCVPYEWDLYRPWQRRRLDVLPGCTGLWQVTARSHVAFEEMVILDLHYAHHGSVASDLWLIVQTLPAMLRGRGGY